MTAVPLRHPPADSARHHEHVPFLDLAAAHAQVRTQLDMVWHRAVDTSAFIGGEEVERFEGEWARYCEAEHAVGVANGTDALVLALRALGVGEGDEVVVPTNTFVASAAAVVLAGAAPRFVDVDPDTLLMTPDGVGAAITGRTAAVMVVHLFGHVADVDGVITIARRHGLAVVEDAAQAHGATRHGRRAGSVGDVGCFSFYPGKNLGALGDGGAVVTDSRELATRVRTLANHGRAGGAHYDHERVGTNSRLDALQAAVLRTKLACLDEWNAGRRAASARYRRLLAEIGVRAVAEPADSVGVDHLFVVRVPERDTVRARLADAGVATGVHYPVPCHRQPALSRFASAPLPVAEAAAPQILSLPMFPHLTDAQVDHVVAALARAVAG